MYSTAGLARSEAIPTGPNLTLVSDNGVSNDRCRDIEATTIPCANGSVLFYQDDPADHLFEVVQGVVKLFMLTPDGRRQVTSFCYPGQFLGHGSDDSYQQTAEAVGTVVVRRYPAPNHGSAAR